MKFNRTEILICAVTLLTSVMLWAGPSAVSAGPAASAAATVSPTPTPVRSPSPTSSPGQTVESLQAKIRQRLFSPEVRRGHIGIKIVSLNTGTVVFENDSEKYFMPASNMKNFTVATALERLTPDFRFITSVYAGAMPDANGTVAGDLRIFGRGDISISTAFNNGDYYKGIDNLADRIVAAGVKRIEGSLVGDESYFKGFAIPLGWEWDDLQWYDGAEISAMPINNNSVDLVVKPGSNNSPCVVSIRPENSLFQITNRCETSAAGSQSTLKVFKALDRNVLEISGTLPAGGNGFTGYLTFTHPAELFMALLRQRLELKGVTIAGATRLLAPGIDPSPGQVEIANLESPPLALIAAKTMKPSQNMFTETILWTLGEQVGRKGSSNADSSALGLGVVKGFMKQIGVPDDGIRQYDGSGMSRHDLVTPAAVVTLYTYMAKQSKFAQAWRDSLSIGGVDGTLSRRFVGTAAAGNLRGKTGTLDQVSALSGYLTTAGGDQLIVSIIVNGVPDVRTRISTIDDIVVNLANFDGKLN